MAQNEVRIWNDQVMMAKQTRKDIEDDWRRNLNWYEGFQQPKDNQGADIEGLNWVVFNLTRNTIQRLVPGTYFTNPKVIITPKRAQDMENGRHKLNEAILNYEIERMRLKRQMKRAITDAFLCLFGVIKIGFDSEFRITSKKTKEHLNPENIFVNTNSIWNLRVSPFKFYSDPQANNLDLSEARWVVHEIDRFLDDVKEDPFFENTVNLQPTSMVGSDIKTDSDEFTEKVQGMDHRLLVKLFEIWDRKTERVFIMAENHPKLLKKMKWPWDVGGFPFEVITFEYCTDKLYPKTNTDNFLHLQDWINHSITQVMENGMRNMPKTRVSKRVKTEEINKLESPFIHAIVRGEEQDFGLVPQGQVSQDVYNGISIARDGMNIIGGLNELQRGGVPRGTRTATVANLLERNAAVLAGENVDAAQDFFKELSTKNLKLVHEVYGDEKIVRIAGDQPGTWTFQSYSSKDIKGDFDIEIEPYSALPRDKERDKQDAILLTNLMLDPRVIQGAGIDVVQVVADLLRRFDRKDIDKLLPQLTQRRQPQQERDPEQENVLLANGARLTVGPNENHVLHITAHLAAREVLANEGSPTQGFDIHILQHQQFMMQQPGQQGGQPQGQTGILGQGVGLIPGIENLTRQNGGQIQIPELAEGMPAGEEGTMPVGPF